MATPAQRKKALESLRELKRQCSRFNFEILEGLEAPAKYTVTFQCRTFIQEGGEIRRTGADYLHEVDIFLNDTYGVQPPEIIWKTKIFHPNISPSGHACILGGLWDPQRKLSDVCIQLFEMAGFKNFDANHPLAEAREAADWVRKQPADIFPADDLPIIDQL